MFDGETPCDEKGNPLTSIEHSNSPIVLADGLEITHSFSSKPADGYHDYYDKLTTYANILTTYAALIDPTATPKAFPAFTDDDEDSVFLYIDTASSRAGIRPITDRLTCNAVAIIGLGGTGAYILDLIAKTPVRNIHLFDGDVFLQHNAFRAPGAASIEDLQNRHNKSQYFRSIYSKMRRNIHAHGYVDDATAGQLEEMDFAFLAVDSGQARKLIRDHLVAFGVPFIDVGMGVLEGENGLMGHLRTTTVTGSSRDLVSIKYRQQSPLMRMTTRVIFKLPTSIA